MAFELLHVLKATLSSAEEADDVLRCMRRSRPLSGAVHAVLLFCDLPPCHTAVSPQDADIIRRLQSGVASCASREPGAWLLLVRRRAWNSAERMYLGQEQERSVEQVMCDLLLQGKTDASFHAATCSPSQFKNSFRAVLFSSANLFCTPDTILRMYKAMHSASLWLIGARIAVPYAFPHTILTRLERSGFSLSAAYSTRQDILRRKHCASDDAPRMYDVSHMQQSLSCACNAAEANGCVFVRRQPAMLKALFDAHFRRVLTGKERFPFLPLLQLLLLFLGGGFGLPLPALASVILPEYYSLLHPSLLPSALIRLALLPLTSAVTFDAMLTRLFSRSPSVRFRLPAYMLTSSFCTAAGFLLIVSAFSTVHALYVLLLPGLLWLSAPLIIPALSMPTVERIPVSEDEQSQLLSLAQNAFSLAHSTAASPARQMLISCCGAMLGLLEADEAARQVQTLLNQSMGVSSLPDPVDQTCVLVSAQYLREQMSQCDAALRSLPAQLERYILSLPPPQGNGALCRLIQTAHAHTAGPFSAETGAAPALQMLFLPLGSARETAMHSLTLPLTHPHTYLERHPFKENAEADDPVGFFLSLSASALSHPFYALLLRSPVAGPYMPLLSIQQCHSSAKESRSPSKESG